MSCLRDICWFLEDIAFYKRPAFIFADREIFWVGTTYRLFPADIRYWSFSWYPVSNIIFRCPSLSIEELGSFGLANYQLQSREIMQLVAYIHQSVRLFVLFCLESRLAESSIGQLPSSFEKKITLTSLMNVCNQGNFVDIVSWMPDLQKSERCQISSYLNFQLSLAIGAHKDSALLI